MSDVAIRVEHLFKQFRLGSAAPYHRFSEFLQGLAAAPVRAVTRKRRSVRTGPAEAEAAAPTSFYALNDVSFEVKQGEVLGIIGRNGAGKSTLLKILSRITEPTAGRAEIHGRVGSLLEVGTGFHPELTGRENIFLNGAILGMTRSEVKAKFDEIVAFAETEKFLDTPVKRYSSGMYTRLAFAVAAHLEPEILVIDEVLAVGDAQFQKKCLGKMDDVAKSGRTVLFVSHNMAAVRSLCQSAICLHDGVIVAEGSVHEVADRYQAQAKSGMLASKEWEQSASPGDRKSKLRSIRVVSRNDAAGNTFTVGSPLDIEVDVSNEDRDSLLNISLHLFAAEGTQVFNTFSYPQQVESGNLRFVCHIPSNLLNDGYYTLGAMLVKDAGTIVAEVRHAVGFNLDDIEREVPWYGKIPGVVRPDLEWSCEYV